MPGLPIENSMSDTWDGILKNAIEIDHLTTKFGKMGLLDSLLGKKDEGAGNGEGSLKDYGSSWTPMTWAKIVALTLLFIVLTSFNYTGLTLSTTVLEKPLPLILVGFIDALLLGYFVTVSRWTGWKEWVTVFLMLYGVNYVLTAMEAVYLPNLLTMNIVFSLLVNGAIVSGIFAAVLVLLLGGGRMRVQSAAKRLAMHRREWAWKIIGASVLYLVLFGFAVYIPFARLLDPVALAAEQSAVPASAAAFIFPLEAFRGVIWVLLAVPAIIALPFGWRKTAVIVGLLFAFPMSGIIGLSTTIASGLIPAHLAEVFGENFVFGALSVWILHLRSRLPAIPM